MTGDDVLARIVGRISPIGLDADGGTTRLAYSAEERAAHEALLEFFDERFDTSWDSAGNLLVTLPGTRPELPSVVTGSHLDSVPSGGRWDGALGVYTGAAALVALADGARPLRSVRLVAFASEESPRFAQAAYRFGSRAMAGIADVADTGRLADSDGVTLGEAMRRLGLDPARIGDAAVPDEHIHALVELHIDQGLTLVHEGVPVSAVSAITGSVRLRVSVTGQADHSGAARMTNRRDALAGAAEMVLAVEETGLADESGDLVTTVGTIRVEPSSVSVVPGFAEFTIDVRSVDAARMAGAVASVQREIERIAGARLLEVVVQQIRDVAPIPMSEAVTAAVTAALSDSGIRPAVLPSHAGHDTGSFAGHPRLGMIFVRNRSGRSHSRSEDIDWADAVLGEQVLRRTLLTLANEPAPDEETR